MEEYIKQRYFETKTNLDEIKKELNNLSDIYNEILNLCNQTLIINNEIVNHDELNFLYKNTNELIEEVETLSIILKSKSI